MSLSMTNMCFSCLNVWLKNYAALTEFCIDAPNMDFVGHLTISS